VLEVVGQVKWLDVVVAGMVVVAVTVAVTVAVVVAVVDVVRENIQWVGQITHRRKFSTC
jgi:hypothetical protein